MSATKPHVFRIGVTMLQQKELMQHAKEATQGHKYLYGETEVIALESGITVEVMEVEKNRPCSFGKKMVVKASWLKPLPMKYYSGETPE